MHNPDKTHPESDVHPRDRLVSTTDDPMAWWEMCGWTGDFAQELLVATKNHYSGSPLQAWRDLQKDFCGHPDYADTKSEANLWRIPHLSPESDEEAVLLAKRILKFTTACLLDIELHPAN